MNATLYNRDFEDMIKVRIWRWREYHGLSRWTFSAITSVFIGGKQREITDGRGHVREAEAEREDGGRGREPLEKAKNQIFA